MDENSCTFIGNLTRDPAIGTSKSGNDYALFAIAVNKRWKDRDGEMQENVQYVNVSCNNKFTIAGAKVLAKGSRCYVKGEITLNKGKDKDGNPRWELRLQAEKVINLTPKQKEREEPSFDPEEIEKEIEGW